MSNTGLLRIFYNVDRLDSLISREIEYYKQCCNILYCHYIVIISKCKDKIYYNALPLEFMNSEKRSMEYCRWYKDFSGLNGYKNGVNVTFFEPQKSEYKEQFS